MADIQTVPRLGTHLDLTAEKLSRGQDPKGMVMCFFRNTHPEGVSGFILTRLKGHRYGIWRRWLGPRVQIQGVSVNRQKYAAGRMQIQRLDPIALRPVQPSIPEWNPPEAA